MNTQRSPLVSLRDGHWFKLICGASYHHLPAIQLLACVYALAGADCIDVAADSAIVVAARAGLSMAAQAADHLGRPHYRLPSGPWVMISLNDGEDPHFRKAAFDPADCPAECPRPCEQICPAQAISFQPVAGQVPGVIDSHCYGCGRCLPVCPIQHIHTRAYVSTPIAIAAQLFAQVDAVEIHTHIDRAADFERLWQAISPWVNQLKLISISCPPGAGVTEYLRHLWEMMQPLSLPVVWQTDGRPMSGDIGHGTTTATIRYGQKVLASGLPGYVQLAGGTNSHTVEKLRQLNLLNLPASKYPPALAPQSCDPKKEKKIAGVAYGSYARKLLMPLIEELDLANLNAASLNPANSPSRWESGLKSWGEPHQSFDKPARSPAFSLTETNQTETNQPEVKLELLQRAVDLAYALVSPLKQPWLYPMDFTPGNGMVLPHPS